MILNIIEPPNPINIDPAIEPERTELEQTYSGNTTTAVTDEEDPQRRENIRARAQDFLQISPNYYSLRRAQAEENALSADAENYQLPESSERQRERAIDRIISGAINRYESGTLIDQTY